MASPAFTGEQTDALPNGARSPTELWSKFREQLRIVVAEANRGRSAHFHQRSTAVLQSGMTIRGLPDSGVSSHPSGLQWPKTRSQCCLEVLSANSLSSLEALVGVFQGENFPVGLGELERPIDSLFKAGDEPDDVALV